MTAHFSENLQNDDRERVLLVGMQIGYLNQAGQHDFHYALDEAAELIQAASGNLIATASCKRDKIHPALFIGTGKAEELAQSIQQQSINLVIFNHELSPTQERNLEKIFHCRVLDRVGLILSIFAKRARTQEGKLQVELAQLTHLSSRLVRGYGHLKSQKGGIGLKGPGETQLETDRRLIGERLARLRRRLKEVKKQRATQRKGREKSQIPTFALVGYTNAGKSTLFNSLTKSNVFAQDLLFATLDTTARKLWLTEDTNIILTDTVGFIRNLPHTLIAAFSATLEETAQADYLLHILDATSHNIEQQISEVQQVLQEIGAAEIPCLMIYNKIDRLPEKEQKYGIMPDFNGDTQVIYISAHTRKGLAELREILIDTVKNKPKD